MASRLETAQTKYSKLTNWDQIKTADPSNNHKYLDWIGSYFSQGISANKKIDSSKIEEIKNLLVQFEKKKPKLTEKDISKYTFDSLIKALSDAGASQKEEKIKGIINLKETSGASMVLIETLEAMKKYGAGTKWCVTQREHFNSYCKNYNIFVVSRNKTKLCIILNIKNKTSQIFQPNDVDTYDFSQYKEFHKFLGLDESFKDITNIINVCKTYSEKYKNKIYKINEAMNTMYYSAKKLNFNKIISDSKSNFTQKEFYEEIINVWFRYDKKIKFIDFIFENRGKYPEIEKVISNDQNSFYSSNQGYIYYASYWKEITTPKPDKKSFGSKSS